MTFCTHYMRQSMQNAISYSFQKSILCPLSPVSLLLLPIVVCTLLA